MPSDDKDGWKIEVKRGAELAAEAVVGRPVDGIGVLWWIEVQPRYEGSGLGKRLLGKACQTLTEAGAREVILYVDEDDPEGERSRVKANQLYDGAGFKEIDRLYSYVSVAEKRRRHLSSGAGSDREPRNAVTAGRRAKSASAAGAPVAARGIESRRGGEGPSRTSGQAGGRAASRLGDLPQVADHRPHG